MRSFTACRALLFLCVPVVLCVLPFDQDCREGGDECEFKYEIAGNVVDVQVQEARQHDACQREADVEGLCFTVAFAVPEHEADGKVYEQDGEGIQDDVRNARRGTDGNLFIIAERFEQVMVHGAAADVIELSECAFVPERKPVEPAEQG